jgi:pilus assembly protein CpaB
MEYGSLRSSFAGVNSRRVTLIVAVFVAIAAGLLTVRYLNSVPHATAPVAVETRQIVVASVPIRAHEKLLANMLVKVMRPVDQIEPGTYSDPRQAEGDFALISIPAGAPITDTKIGVPASIGITGKLTPGQRAVSIPVDYVKSVSGLIEPGDRVDVLASNTRGRSTRAIIRGAVILAVNSALDPQPATGASPQGSATAGAPGAVTLAVTPAQADLLTFADLNDNLRLALRSPSESVRAFPVQALDIPLDAAPNQGLVVPQIRPVPSNPMPAARATPGILVIEGSEIVAGHN